jgi:hypothetical protein
MMTTTIPTTQKEVEELLRKALKNIEHEHLDELLSIEKELGTSLDQDVDTLVSH